MKHIYFSFLFLAVSILGTAQTVNGVTTYSCNVAQINSAFLKRSAFLIDQNGYKWIGFSSGTSSSVVLVRYNGSAWKKCSYALPVGTKVNGLACDAANNVWVATNNALYKFQDTNIVGTYNYPSLSVACGGGNVYVGTTSGLYVYNGSNFTQYTRALNGLASDTINCIAYESSAAVWLGGNKGIDMFNGSSFTFHPAAGTQTDNVECIYIDGAGNKWIGTDLHGVIRYDNTNFSTMSQLYGNPIGVMWPTRTYSISKGPTGGICFADLAPTSASARAGSLLEISGGAVKIYRNIAPSANYTSPQSYYLIQYDQLANQIFYVPVNYFIGTGRILLSLDLSQFSQDIMSGNNSDYLDINNVSALITANADMHWDLQDTKYNVPKTTSSSPLQATSLWMGGYHNGALRMGAMTYRQNGMDFWPGPLDPATDSIDATTSAAYDKVWKVNRFDIANFIYNWNAGNVQNGTFVPAPSILNWPANSATYSLAPYVDLNSNGVYDPIHDGDYPLIKGDQMIWWVFNDKLNKHSESGAMPIGVQVNASAYAFTCPNIADSNSVLNTTTFYNFKVLNLSPDVVDSFYLAPWIDANLGNYQDDYIGCDVQNNFGYIMNGDNYDEDMPGHTGYRNNLPIFSCNILKGPMAASNDGLDNDNNGVIDELNERCMMHTFTYYVNTGDPQIGNPNANSPQQLYNFINGRWKNGTPMTYGATGTTAGGTVCRHLFPGNSDPYGVSMGGSISNPIPPPGNFGSTGWTASQGGIAPADLRFIIGVGPFTMQPAGAYELDYALVFSRDSSNCYNDTINGRTCALPRAKQDNMRVKHWFDTNSFPSCLSLNGVGINENAAPETDLSLYPNPASDQIFISFKTAQGCTVEVLDITGRIVTAATFTDARNYHAIHLYELRSGMYAIRVKTSSGTSIKKFVKE